MAEYRTSDDIRRYDFIKLIVALVLGAIIVIMLLRGNLPRPAATPPEEQERASGIELTEATPPPEETSTIPPVTTEATEMAAPELEEPEVSEDGALALSGTGTPGTTLEIVANGEVLDTVTVGPDGTWALASELAPGDYELAVQNTGDPDSLSETVDVSVAAPQPEAAEDESTVDDTEVVCGVGEAPHGIDQGDTYVVARCEYMGLIAARTGVKLADLIAANPQIANPNLIYPGQVLNLPPRD